MAKSTVEVGGGRFVVDWEKSGSILSKSGNGRWMMASPARKQMMWICVVANVPINQTARTLAPKIELVMIVAQDGTMVAIGAAGMTTG